MVLEHNRTEVLVRVLPDVSVPSTGRMVLEHNDDEEDEGTYSLVSVPSTGRMVLERQKYTAAHSRQYTFQYPLRVEWCWNTEDELLIALLVGFQYPLRVEWCWN